jgi:hypothetical protein
MFWIEKGLQQGEATVLVRQLTKRFGVLPAAVQDRLAQASTAQLEVWAERILDAETLEAVFENH